MITYDGMISSKESSDKRKLTTIYTDNIFALHFTLY